MKIQGRKSPETHDLNLSTQKTQRVTGTGEKGKIAPSQRQIDRINISQRGREVASLIASLDSLPEVREEKVQALKKAVDTGTYRVDPVRIAEKMLSEI